MKQGWEIKKLGEVCKTTSGGTPLKDRTEYYDGGDIPWLRSGEVCCKYIDRTEMFITEQGMANSAAKVLPINTVLVAMYGATAGQVGILKTEAATNQAVCGILPNKEIIPEFLYYYFLFHKEKLVAQAVGGAQPNISQLKIKNTDIPIISLSEQERIVGILDSAFAKIEALRANAQQNLQNTKDLFQASIDKAYAIPTESKPISSVAKVINGYAFSSGDFKPTNAIKSIKITNVGVGEFIEESDNYLPSEYADKLQDAQVNTGDIVIALTRTIISAGLKVAVVPNSYNKALVNQRVAALVPFKGVMSQKYLYNFLLTTKVENYVLEHVNTLMQPNLSITDLKNMDVPYLPYEEQKVVANNIDALNERCRSMEENYRQTIAHCNDLKQALLTKAFNGEL